MSRVKVMYPKLTLYLYFISRSVPFSDITRLILTKLNLWLKIRRKGENFKINEWHEISIKSCVPWACISAFYWVPKFDRNISIKDIFFNMNVFTGTPPTVIVDSTANLFSLIRIESILLYNILLLKPFKGFS